jgi:hypothetical protein
MAGRRSAGLLLTESAFAQESPVASKKERAEKSVRPARAEAADKPIRLNDLLPTRNVSGGRRTVFGSAPPASGNKKKHK